MKNVEHTGQMKKPLMSTNYLYGLFKYNIDKSFTLKTLGFSKNRVTHLCLYWNM